MLNFSHHFHSHMEGMFFYKISKGVGGHYLCIKMILINDSDNTRDTILVDYRVFYYNITTSTICSFSYYFGDLKALCTIT
jgi:hypothetical protein